MPSERANPQAYRFHIRDNVTLARGFVGGFDYERFRDNQLRITATDSGDSLPNPQLR
jgi:hypothetical protein